MAQNIRDEPDSGPVANVLRTGQFWCRATSIYMSFKVTQVQALACQVRGWDDERIEKDLWTPQHTQAGERMFKLCTDLRGFYLKAGQFIGARGDFVPEPICRRLALLHDQVPPMPPAQTRAVLERELGAPLEEVFEWIDLETPLGSASISQVHKAKLLARHMPSRRRWWWRQQPAADTAATSQLPPAALAAMRALQGLDPPKGGIVAVKVQYPDALQTMSLDLKNIRLMAGYLSKTELKFDMVSPVDELAKQIKLEFDFEREAHIMDTIRGHLKGQGALKNIEIPSSIPGLTTKRILVMSYIDGVQITKMKEKMGDYSAKVREIGIRRILSRVSEAYGRMILYEGLFQADGHPGNLLVMKGGRVGLIDYGQSKQLPEEVRLNFCRLVLALEAGSKPEINAALWALGVETPRDDEELRSTLAYGMFDTRGKVDPFDPNSPIKQLEITHFPPDLFFVLRTVQLLRGLATGMGVKEFSAASQWRPFAEEALEKAGERLPLQQPSKSWLPFGPGYGTLWPPAKTELLTQ